MCSPSNDLGFKFFALGHDAKNVSINQGGGFFNRYPAPPPQDFLFSAPLRLALDDYSSEYESCRHY
jgi:hypothetical protein